MSALSSRASTFLTSAGRLLPVAMTRSPLLATHLPAFFLLKIIGGRGYVTGRRRARNPRWGSRGVVVLLGRPAPAAPSPPPPPAGSRSTPSARPARDDQGAGLVQPKPIPRGVVLCGVFR